MIQNTWTDIFKVEGSGGSAGLVTEPISLDDAKAHLYIDGTQDDELIEALIPACRASVEEYCGISIVPKTITAYLSINNFPSLLFGSPSVMYPSVDFFELPYGPVVNVASVSTINFDDSITTLVEGRDYSVRGIAFKFLRVSNSFDNIQIVYNVDYPNAPADLLLAIKNELAFRFETRGDSTNRYAQQNVGISDAASYLAYPHRRKSWE